MHGFKGFLYLCGNIFRFMINYDLKKIKAIIFDVDGVLSAQTVTMDENGEPHRSVNIRDGYAIQLAQKMGLRMVIMTGARTESLRRRYEYLGLEDIYLCCSKKTVQYEEFKAKHGLKDEEIAYMGDDIPDLEVMRRVGCPCCPTDAAQEIKEASIYVSDRKGGYGCGRDLIEQVMKAQGLWMADEKAFGW